MRRSLRARLAAVVVTAAAVGGTMVVTDFAADPTRWGRGSRGRAQAAW